MRLILLPLIAIAVCAQPGLRFDVASIRPAKDGTGKGGLEILPGGGLKMGGVTTKQLISFAYSVPEDRIAGGPSWLGSQAFNVLATADDPGLKDSGPNAGPGTSAWDRTCLRTQALLSDRFSLVIRKDSKESPGYALVVAKGGTKLTPSPGQAPPGTMRSPGRIDSRAGTMEMLATVLSQMLRRPVADRTGLAGGYDYKVEYAPDRAVAPDSAPAALAGPSVFTALQEQLGLKLENARLSTETIVVVRVERPSEN